MYDVARHAGVSKSLVSLVIRQAPGVSPARRESVLAAIEELGYKPSRAAATLAGHSSHSIGVVIDDYRNLSFIHLVDGIRFVMDQHDYHVTVSDRHTTGALGHDTVDGFLSMQVEGIVLAGEQDDLGARRLHIPIVIAGERDAQVGGADIVANDDVAGAIMAVEHLLAYGHRKIGHLTGRGGAAGRRLDGYENVMRREGLEPLVYGHGYDTDDQGAYKACVMLFDEHPDVTAVFAANDLMSLGAVGALHQRGLSVPGDVSLVGYDDSPLARSPLLDLTTIDDKSYDVGVEVAKTMLARIDKLDTEPRRQLITPALVVRSSTKNLNISDC